MEGWQCAMSWLRRCVAGFPTAVTRVQFEAIRCGICDGQRGTRTGFSRSTSVVSKSSGRLSEGHANKYMVYD